jgi:hypothetical protein
VAKKYEGMITATDELEVEKSKMQELKVRNIRTSLVRVVQLIEFPPPECSILN